MAAAKEMVATRQCPKRLPRGVPKRKSGSESLPGRLRLRKQRPTNVMLPLLLLLAS